MILVNDSIPIAGIVRATKEAKELHRIRTSFTFRIGIEVVRSLKNPFRLFGFPIRAVRLLVGSKDTKTRVKSTPRTSYVIIGIDRVSDKYSKQAALLSQVIRKSNIGNVTLLNNSTKITSDLTGVEWYRIPPVRGGEKSRKEWNLLLERLLSSAISIARPKHIIYFGDYLYRGLIDSLVPVEKLLEITWFPPHEGQSKSIDHRGLASINVIPSPEFTNVTPASKSIHRLLRCSEAKEIVLVDILPDHQTLYDAVVEAKQEALIAAVQRKHSLPPGIDRMVRVKEIMGMRLEGKISFVLDDNSPLLPSLPSLNIPCLLFRTGAVLSPILETTIRNMELRGILVVIRRNTDTDIAKSVDYFASVMANPLYQTLVEQQTSRDQAFYHLEWLSNSPQSYN